MVSADMGFFKKKHQGEIQEFTPLAISEYVKRADEVFVKLQEERERMKEIHLTKRIIAELLGRAVVEEEFITTTQLNIIKREMLHPTHDYGHPNSMWEIYNFCSFSLKEIHPSLWMRNHLAAHSFFVRESGLITPVSIAVGEVAPNQTSMFDVPEFAAQYPLTPEECFETVPEKESSMLPEEHVDVIPEDAEFPEDLELPMEEPPMEEPTMERPSTTTDETTEYSDLV